MTRLKLRLSALLLLLSSSAAWAQKIEATEKINREFTVAGDAGRAVLALYNIHGSVVVQGHAGNKVVIEATKTIRADNAQTLEVGKAEAQLGFLQRNDSVLVYTTGPYDSRPRQNNNGRDWNHKEIDYRYAFDYVVKVPYALNLRVSTVNQGKVEVQDVTGQLNVTNVNGAISLNNVKGTTKAHTVNGNVEATYVSSPPGASSYHTINGQIKVKYPASIDADMHFKSMNGQFYTDFPNPEVLPAQVTKNQEGRGGGTVYKLSKATAVRLGKGGTDLRFETLNGSVYVTKK